MQKYVSVVWTKSYLHKEHKEVEFVCWTVWDRKWNWFLPLKDEYFLFTNPVQNADRFDLLIVCNLMSSKSENNY